MPELRRLPVNGVELNVALAGSGPAVLLLHGFPHTWELWTDVMAGLSDHYRVIAPDLRGLGASGGTATGYDAATLAEDAAALLTALGVSSAAVVGIDAGAAPAFLLAMRRPGPVRRLVLVEAVLGGLPGAEDFLADGPPWWFGFHAAAPGLAETVLEGHEAAYVDWFLNAGTLGDGVRPALRDAFVRAYTGRPALGRAFSYYRALPESAAQIGRAVTSARLTVPTMAVGARPVGAALERQLRPVTDDLTGHLVEDCGHIVPLHRPDALLALLRPFLAGTTGDDRAASVPGGRGA
ncbi:Pimeloyl-ACP methyl ester carboxylesterase [Streptomyces sp. TLI_053]|uniref:alpha/beta fold hydrolase n=1 Tax=Streptomyces sp. TLI_053 TaxID=1855352 RepID=UPI00087B81DC|nr:alpha/beta fold hydrolase [Streptomyces sp. TLI_053]SDT80908.1 Pimeloyl-ACP methyl ester carboxylesterase [Streptomyces sp. TLI_053]